MQTKINKDFQDEKQRLNQEKQIEKLRFEKQITKQKILLYTTFGISCSIIIAILLIKK